VGAIFKISEHSFPLVATFGLVSATQLIETNLNQLKAVNAIHFEVTDAAEPVSENTCLMGE